MKENKLVLYEFIKRLTASFKTNQSLILNLSSFQTFKSIELNNSKTVNEFEGLKSVEGEFDFILGDLPYGMKPVDSELRLNKKINYNWNLLYQGLKKLSNLGIAFFLVEPAILFTEAGKSFFNALENEGYYLNAAFNPPEKIYSPQTAFNPVLLSFKCKANSNIFIAEINPDNTDVIVSNYRNSIDSKNLETGTIVNKKDFESFEKYKISLQIEYLKTQYKDYRNYRMFEIAASINTTSESYSPVENSLYIPRIGSSSVVSSIEETKIKHQNYFQIVLNPNIVFADYLRIFYKSQLGKLILSSLGKGTFIPRINKKEIEDSYVAVPKIEEQELIIQTDKRLEGLQNTIHELKLELSLNPKNTEIILDKINNTEEAFKELTLEDRILSRIREGEGKKLEFKQTFSKNIRTNQKDKEIEKSSLKTIVGFLNSLGGTLLIGVSDDGLVTGIEEDFFINNDKYLLHFKNLIKSKIGPEIFDLIDYRILPLSGKKILKVDCQPSNQPCFYEDAEFFIRTNPATDKLIGRKQIDYIRNHFKQ